MEFRPESTDQDLQEIRALWNEWDPIGVWSSENDILDEYDFYLLPWAFFSAIKSSSYNYRNRK